MTSIAYSSVNIQASAHSVPSTPCWFGEMTMIAHHLKRQGTLAAVEEQVRFARRRFGRYEVIDFVAVLLGYAISGERTLEAFYEQIQPWASAFMALFGRDRLPARSTLSRFLASLDQAAIEALRTLFLKDLLARPLNKEEQRAGLWDRQGSRWGVFDVDGTREAARQRALPQTPDRPSPQRRLRPICAPGYTGRKRGEVVRTRTTVLQAHTHQWIGTFGNPGNGEYRAELRRAVAAIRENLKAHTHPEERALLRLDGQYGTGAVLADLAGLAYVMRWQRLSNLEASRGPGSPETASRSAPDPPGKWDSPRALRLPWSALGTRGYAVPGDRGNSSCRDNQESDWRHPLRRGLRTLLDETPPERVHRCRCRGAVSASRGV